MNYQLPKPLQPLGNFQYPRIRAMEPTQSEINIHGGVTNTSCTLINALNISLTFGKHLRNHELLFILLVSVILKLVIIRMLKINAYITFCPNRIGRIK